ncbi:hypothetical protein Cantr_10504 [Candida viswanathii]|uniref:Uncharacterized protein n=1 Tax=Candida viswanathii TaxID=5486 RepID=A0A367YE70_9ASCO|nr:hypothetical protein Cantr_10504 [Candida viswanathii]
MSSLQPPDEPEKTKAFATAIIHWLSEFPKSPIAPDTTIDVFLQPPTLYKIFKVLFLRDDFEALQNDKWFLENEAVMGTSVIHIHEYTMKQIDILDELLDLHLRAKVDLNTMPHLNLYKLVVFQDHGELKKMCQILFRIGTSTSRLSTNGLAYVEFLTDVDKTAINQFKETGISVSMANRKKNKYPGLREKTMPPAETNSDYDCSDSKSGGAGASGSCYYIEEEVWDALNWENAIYESLIYKLSREMHN